MLSLNEKSLQDRASWEAAGFVLPGFDRNVVRERTFSEPCWVHFGAGNIFRAFIADIQQQLLNEGLQDTGIITADGYDGEVIDIAYKQNDNLCISVILKSDGTVEKKVISSITEALKIDAKDFPRLKDIFASKSLQMLSLTITEKGYSLKNGEGSLFEDVAADLAAGPETPVSYMGKLTALCYHRYISGAAPLTLVSMDNISSNGKCLHEAVRCFAEEWVKAGLADKGFLDYVDDPGKLSFPWTMIDKITPGPDDSIAKLLRDSGLDISNKVVTEKKTEIAAFVNAEETGYLVIEDSFPNGRPPLEKAGVIMTGRETVNKVEKMKVCTCLNPLHTSLAIFACLLKIPRVSESMKDEDIVRLVNLVAKEGMAVVVDPGIISPQEFVDTVINIRLPNPFIPDTPQRIATDTSKKLSVRFGETIKAYGRSDSLDVNSLRAIPLSLAGWCRYLVGIDDFGKEFPLDPDPMLPELNPIFNDMKLGQDMDYKKALQPLLSNASIFGIDLYKAGIADSVIEYFKEMMKAPGAVRRVLSSFTCIYFYG